ncbi:MAG: YqaJ viral recombinase family protein [Eubacteriales bacterium]
MGEITKVKTASREEWKELRSHYIGGSDAAAVVGLNSFSSPYSLWAEKTGKTPGFAGNLATEVGMFLEEFVAKKFEEETGKKVRKANMSFFNSDYPWAIANIDRDVVGEDSGLEIKTTSELNMKKFSGGEYPANYYVQCVHYLAVTGKARWYLAVLIGNRDFRVFTIERDEAEISALMEAEKDFWSLVKSDTPPSADGSAATSSAISTIYSGSNDGTADLFAVSDSLADYDRITNLIKDLETERDEASNKIKAFMGDAGYGEHECFRVSWKSQQRRVFDAKRFAEDHPGENLDNYYNVTNSRVFRVTKKKGV